MNQFFHNRLKSWWRKFSHIKALVFFTMTLAATGALADGSAPTSPTLLLDYGRGQPSANSISQFMYFVPLISPEPVFVVTNSGNTQFARVTSFARRTSGGTFLAICEFEFTGEGFQRSVLNHTNLIRQHEKELKSGGVLRRQLGSITVEGAGRGWIEVEGTVTNGIRSADEIRMHFNAHGRTSPVSITLQDIACRDGTICIEDKLVAQVNTLTFRRATGTPAMEITLASLNRADASDNIWQNLMGHLKGIVVNQFLPPITIEAAGQKAMLDFGQALADEAPTFTFPCAKQTPVSP